MSHPIEKVAVIGAGTMGAAIAAQVANAGLPVILLDIAPRKLTGKEEAKGLTLEHRKVRQRIVQEGFDRIRKLKPASFMSRNAEKLVQLGNLEDDLEKLAGVDWIIEAIVERLDVKRDLMSRIDAVRLESTIVTTNTSGLPIAQICEGLSDDFRRHFFGTHFFNPPRYMKLLEIIRGDEADPLAVSSVAEIATQKLGKGVVFCRDTPNFIGNRILSINGSSTIGYALEHGYRFEEVDAVTGPLIGRPKTATFRLQDLVGIDIAAGVASNLYELIPEDENRELLKHPKSEAVLGALLERGSLGNKAGSGFYRKGKGPDGKKIFEVLNAETLDYESPQKVRFESMGELRKVADLGTRVKGFYDPKWADDRAARLVRAAIGNLLSYAAAKGPEIAFDLVSIDQAVCWGFAYEMGPFELWDALGVAETAEALRDDGFEVASWVDELLASGASSFYQSEAGRVIGAWDWENNEYRRLPERQDDLRLDDLRSLGRVEESNDSASLLDMGEGVLLLEFHSKMNAIDGGTVEMMRRAKVLLDEDAWYGLVIGNDGANFCVGANLMGVGHSAMAGDFDGIREASKALQHALRDLRYHRKPVVAAVHGMALGGGAEIALGVDRIVAHAETYMGLVEVGVGLVPAGGGLKELVRRVISPAAAAKNGDPLPAAGRALEAVAMAKVSTSAAEAAERGFFSHGDRIIMNRDLLLAEARQEVLSMVTDGYLPEQPAQLYAGGRDLYAALLMVPWSMQQAAWASEHDALLARKIAYILCGGDGSSPGWMAEEHFLRLEREAFADLVQTEKTQARMKHMLETGKPLRN